MGFFVPKYIDRIPENALQANELPIVMAPNNRGDVELKQDTIKNYKVSTSGGDIYRLPSGNYRLGDNVITLLNLSELNIKNTGQQEGEIIKWRQNTVPVPPAQTEHNDANHDNTDDTKESGSTPPAQLIAGDNAKTVRKDNGKSLIGAYEPGSSDTPEDTENQSTEDQTMEEQVMDDQITGDQVTGEQRTEDAGDDQKSTAENNPADHNPTDNDLKPDDSVNLPSKNSSHSGGWIPVICICAGALVIGLGLHLGFRKWKKTDRK